jgi:hypothetical protein
VPQRRVRRDAGAQQRRGDVEGEALRDLPLATGEVDVGVAGAGVLDLDEDVVWAEVPAVDGDRAERYEAMELTADPGLTIHVYTAEPDSASADALNLLASWAATLDRAAATPDQASERHRT